MNIKWKQQHYNNSCASACLAMLLSHRGIDKQDTDVIIETEMPYLIRLHQESKSYEAGVLVQGKRYFDIMLKRYGLMFSEYRTADWFEYIKKAEMLLERSQPFITGVNPSCLSNHNSTMLSNNSHAIVIYRQTDSFYSCYDPDAGLERNIEHDFHAVRRYVSKYLTLDQFKMAVMQRKTGNGFVIGYLEESTDTADDFEQIIQESMNAINQYKKYAREKLDLLKIENDIPVYKDFYEFIIDVVKPIALDLNTAIAISEQNNDQSSSILVSLNNYKQSVLGIQAKLKNKTLSDWELEKNKLLNEIANIQSIVLKHLGKRDMKDLASI